MQYPIEVVRGFCAAWSENRAAHELAEFFTDDAVYHNIPLKPVAGRDDIENTIATFIRPGPPGIESIDFRVINIAANGPVVMTERVDVFTVSGRSFELPVMGTFGSALRPRLARFWCQTGRRPRPRGCRGSPGSGRRWSSGR